MSDSQLRPKRRVEITHLGDPEQRPAVEQRVVEGGARHPWLLAVIALDELALRTDQEAAVKIIGIVGVGRIVARFRF